MATPYVSLYRCRSINYSNPVVMDGDNFYSKGSAYLLPLASILHTYKMDHGSVMGLLTTPFF
jgi:hypothetical protein